MAATAVQYTILVVAVVVLMVGIIFTSRWLKKHLRAGPPAHTESRDEWVGDDVDDDF